ncbi:MAG: hypothetical protein IPM35_38640 [Myxococcales bacterium]|nr:hypothetical protein [Myxococcales bacterium]
MARSKAVIVLSVCSLLVACGGTTPPPENPTPPEPKEEPKPAVEPKEEPKAEEPKKEETPPPPAAPELPKSSVTIGGVSISEIDPKTLVAAVQKAGWAPENVEINHGTVGKFESIEFGILKGTDQGKFNLVRRAAMPSGSSGSMMAPKDLAAMHKDSAAVYLDEAADVVVWIKLDGGKPAVAKKALDSVLKK